MGVFFQTNEYRTVVNMLCTDWRHRIWCTFTFHVSNIILHMAARVFT